MMSSSLVIPFDKRLPNISQILRHRWQCLVDRDQKAKQYMSKPPRVGYSRTESLRDIMVRSKVPPTTYKQNRRQATTGFRKCCQRADCSVCTHSVNCTSHTCNHTRESFTISSHITCNTPGVIYSVSCGKDSGECARVGGPQYIGYTERPAKTRFSEHLGSATQQCHENTSKPVGVHFRAAGHHHGHMIIFPIGKVRSKDK